MKLFIGVLMMVSTVVAAQWQHDVQTDLMTNIEQRVMALEAGQMQGTLNHPVIVFRYTVITQEVHGFVYWGGYSISRDERAMLVRFDDEFEIVQVRPSTDRRAVFIVDIDDFVNRLMRVDTVVARIDSNTGRTMVAMWDVSRFKEAYDTMTR